MKIGDRIRERRKILGLTQKELARKVKVSSQVVSNWERGYTDPDHDDIARLAEALETSSDYLLNRTDEPLNIISLSKRKKIYSSIATNQPNK